MSSSEMLTPIQNYPLTGNLQRPKPDQFVLIEPSAFAEKVKAIMNDRFPDGHSFTVYSNQSKHLISGSGGFARRAVDQPEIKASPTDRVNLASVSKMITAAAVASVLRQKNLPADTLVAAFLPPLWNVHPAVKTLTFADFLTHRTGFDNDPGSNPNKGYISDGSTYDEIKFSLEKGPTFKPKADYRYVNMNFNIFRIILPYLNSYNSSTKKVTLAIPAGNPPDKFLADTYVTVVNERVLQPSGVAYAGCSSETLLRPSAINPLPRVPVLLYEYNNPTRHGLDLGDQTLTCGASGWNLSVVDLSKVLQNLLFTENIVPEKDKMLFTTGEQNTQEGFGMNRDTDLAGSKVFSHGGWLPFDERQLHAGYLYFEATGIIVTSIGTGGHKSTGANWFGLITEAYDQTYSKALTAYTTNNGTTQHILAWNEAKHIYEFFGGTNWSKNDLTLAANNAPIAVANPLGFSVMQDNGQQHVIYPFRYEGSQDTQIGEISAGKAWEFTDISAQTKAPLPAGKMVAYTTGNTRHVVYREGSGHIIELWASGKNWNWGNVTVRANVDKLALSVGNPSAYTTEKETVQHIVYRDKSGHIHELFASTSWNHGVLTMRAFVTPDALAADDPVGYTTEGGTTQRVIYTGKDGHVHGLWAGSAWIHENLTQLVGISGTSLPAGKLSAYAMESSKVPHIVYRGRDSHIHELWLGNGKWYHNNLTLAANAPLPAGDPVSYISKEGNAEVQNIVYTGIDNGLHRLSAGGQWIHQDIGSL